VAKIGAAPDGKGIALRYGRPVLADEWWFWLLTGAVVGLSALASRRYRELAAAFRRVALQRRLVEPAPGQRVDTRAGGFLSDLSWVSILLGAWVAASPWIWGYEDVNGAVSADAVTGGAVIGLTIAGIVFPSLNALTVPAGLWLVLAPWLVGYGSENGAVGLSDVIAGVLIAALGLAALAAASRRIAPGAAMPIGRIRRSPDQ
jgi:hypothetical protein